MKSVLLERKVYDGKGLRKKVIGFEPGVKE